MSEVKRISVFIHGPNKKVYMVEAAHLDRVTAERDAALGREAELREELEMARDDLVIFKSAVSALGEASKKLVFCARTSGGTAGPDQGLMDACAGVEGVITLGGIARAMNEFERLTSERDDLASRLEQGRDRKNSIVDLQQRLTAADDRAAGMEGLLDEFEAMQVCDARIRGGMPARWQELIVRKRAALKPVDEPTQKAKPKCHWACTGCDICGSAGHGNSWS